MIRTARWLDLTFLGFNLLAAVAMLSVLGVLAWLSWGVVRTDADTTSRTLRGFRSRALGALWFTVAVLIITAVPREIHASSLGLPAPWSVSATDGAGRAYALLALGGYVALVQVIVALGALTRRRGDGLGAKPSRQRSSDLGVALVSSLGLLPAALVVVAGGILAYVQLLAHAGHS